MSKNGYVESCWFCWYCRPFLNLVVIGGMTAGMEKQPINQALVDFYPSMPPCHHAGNFFKPLFLEGVSPHLIPSHFAGFAGLLRQKKGAVR